MPVLFGRWIHLVARAELAPRTPDELPAGATSLRAEGTEAVDRTTVLVTVLTRLAERESAWRSAGGDPDAHHLRADFRAACSSLGAEVRVELPGGMTARGMAEDVDRDGRLLLLGADGRRRAVAACPPRSCERPQLELGLNGALRPAPPRQAWAGRFAEAAG